MLNPPVQLPYPLRSISFHLCASTGIQAFFQPKIDIKYPGNRRYRRQARIGIQIVRPPLPVRGSKLSLWRSRLGASAGVIPLFGNHSFQIAS
jgi:hypothetical protein